MAMFRGMTGAGIATRLCVFGIMIGIFFMIQPWVFALFKWGFFLLLLSTIVYTVVGRFPERRGEPNREALGEEAPSQTSSVTQ